MLTSNQDNKNSNITKNITILILYVLLLALGFILAKKFLFDNFDDKKLLLDNFNDFLKWYFAFAIMSLVGLPLSTKIFERFADKGVPFAKIVGLLITALPLWLLSYMKLVPFRQVSIVIITVIAGVISLILCGGIKGIKDRLQNVSSVNIIVIQEMLFFLALFAWTFVRGLKPELYGIEKFMDFGFVQSMMRTDFFPAPDMWLAGQPINYYYFGQYVYTFLIKGIGLEPSVGYNLSLAATFATTILLGFSLCYNIASYYAKSGATSLKRGLLSANSTPILSGLLGSFMIAIAGNSYAFFYGKDHPGNFIIRILMRLQIIPGMPNGDTKTTDYWYSDATRFIGYNPDVPDKTIHEFPYYSFILGDLHAHVVSIAFVLLAIAVIFAIYINIKPANNIEKNKWFFLNGITLPIVFLGVIFAVLQMTNYWDFVIYLGLFALVILVRELKCNKPFAATSWKSIVGLVLLGCIGIIYLKVKSPIVFTIAYFIIFAIAQALYSISLKKDDYNGVLFLSSIGSLSMFVSSLVCLPFNMNFIMMSNQIFPTTKHTPIWQMLVLWGGHLLIVGIFLLYIIREKSDMSRINSENDNVFSRSIRAISKIKVPDLFVVLLAFWGLFTLLLPEFLYVNDIYGDTYQRCNTMFKFTYQAFILFGVVIAYAITRLPFRSAIKGELFEIPMSDRRYRFWQRLSVVCLLTLIIPSVYAFYSTQQCVGKIEPSNYVGLSGYAYLGTIDSSAIPDSVGSELADDVLAIEFINKNIKGTHTILEAYGESYSDFCRVSAYTGLPTVIGWRTHETLWRNDPKDFAYSNDMVNAKQAEVRTVYEWSDPETALSIIKKYNIEYIVIGKLERVQFPSLNEDALLKLGDVIFEEESFKLIHLNK